MVARTDTDKPDRAAVEQAAMWQAQLADEDCTDADRAAFEAWLNADLAHRTAFDRMSAIAGRVARHKASGRKTLENLAKRPRPPRGVLAVLLLGATAGLLGWAVRDNPAVRAPMAGQRTAVGQLKSAALPAGDQIILDTDSAADIRPDRSIRLWRGAVMARVEPGQPQPFIVRTPQGSARALGTRFSVRADGASTVVTVIESHVEACATGRTRRCLTLAPGQVARLDAAGAHRLANVDPVAGAAWSQGLLIADDRPLAQVLDELNRYREAPIRYSAADLAGLNLSGALPLTDSNRAMATIRAALPVRVSNEPDGLHVSRR